MKQKHTILGIETSCDETAAAVVRTDKTILSNVVFSQIEAHEAYGGVVPEIAARAHLQMIDEVVMKALHDAETSFEQLDGIAVTAGPGLIGGVIVGVMAAKSYASVHQKPFYAINHLEGHALTARLTDDVPFPYLMLLVSGGHCQILAVEGIGIYKLIGQTIDDALGEAFDKTAKMMGLPYPGGPEIERIARDGDEKRFTFPKPLLQRDDCDFSFSGLKTAVQKELLVLDAAGGVSEQDKADIAASFQYTVGEVLQVKLGRAIEQFKQMYEGAVDYEDSMSESAMSQRSGRVLRSAGARSRRKHIVLAGGVAANHYLRGVCEEIAQKNDMTLSCPPVALCTDNAAMIAWAACEKINHNFQPDALDVEPRARWKLY